MCLYMERAKTFVVQINNVNSHIEHVPCSRKDISFKKKRFRIHKKFNEKQKSIDVWWWLYMKIVKLVIYTIRSVSLNVNLPYKMLDCSTLSNSHT